MGGRHQACRPRGSAAESAAAVRMSAAAAGMTAGLAGRIQAAEPVLHNLAADIPVPAAAGIPVPAAAGIRQAALQGSLLSCRGAGGCRR